MIILSYLSGPHLSSQKCKRKAEEWVRERDRVSIRGFEPDFVGCKDEGKVL